jgi:hypothetical protein
MNPLLSRDGDVAVAKVIGDGRREVYGFSGEIRGLTGARL